MRISIQKYKNNVLFKNKKFTEYILLKFNGGLKSIEQV